MVLNTEEEIKAQYAKEATEYRDSALKVNYEFDLSWETLKEYVGLIFKEHNFPLKVLDIGAGTGMLSERLLKEYPNAQVTMLDFSPEMLAQGKAYFDEHGLSNIKQVCSNFISDQLPEGPYDLIISSYAIHHTRDSKDLENLYQKIANALHENYGTFFCIDYYLANTDKERQEQVIKLRDQLRKHFSEDEVNEWIEIIRSEDTPATRYQTYCAMPCTNGVTRLLGRKDNMTSIYGMTKLPSEYIEKTNLKDMYMRPQEEFSLPESRILEISSYPQPSPTAKKI